MWIYEKKTVRILISKCKFGISSDQRPEVNTLFFLTTIAFPVSFNNLPNCFETNNWNNLFILRVKSQRRKRLSVTKGTLYAWVGRLGYKLFERPVQSYIQWVLDKIWDWVWVIMMSLLFTADTCYLSIHGRTSNAVGYIGLHPRCNELFAFRSWISHLIWLAIIQRPPPNLRKVWFWLYTTRMDNKGLYL